MNDTTLTFKISESPDRIGTLLYKDGKFSFEGDAEESAKIFLEQLNKGYKTKNHYVLIGQKYDYEEFHDIFSHGYEINFIDEIEENYRDSAYDGIKNGITILSDEQTGKYVYIGVVISKSKDYGDINDYTLDGYLPSNEEVSDQISEEFGVPFKLSHLYYFTHSR
jgi:predicted transcriptional regulator